MLYYLFTYLDEQFDLTGAGVFQYISFRAGMAALVSLLITIVFGKYLIRLLQKKQVGESIRDLGLAGQMEKKGTPTMGGLIIIAAIVVPTLLFAKLNNIYIILLIVTTVGLGLIGFLDDYIKVFRKNKEGLAGRFKVVGQIFIGFVVAATLVFHPEVKVREFFDQTEEVAQIEVVDKTTNFEDVKSTRTTVPFVKNNELDYSKILPFETDWTCACIILIVAGIVFA